MRTGFGVDTSDGGNTDDLEILANGDEDDGTRTVVDGCSGRLVRGMGRKKPRNDDWVV